MQEILFMPVHKIAGGLARGDFSSRDLVRMLCEAIAVRDPVVGAYIEVDTESAQRQAAEADAARRSGRRGSLLGVPLAVKDLLNVRGQRCTCASRILEGYVAPYDATVIERLRREGAVFLGRTNMDEFAMGSSTETSACRVTRNPWDTKRVPGGSSGGSAAAVAAGEALAALGTDTGGSIRQPAAFCGCVGLKPTYGRVSRYGVVAYASSFDQVGCLTRDVRDAAILLRAMAGSDPRDATTLRLPVPDYEQALTGDMRGLRIGLPAEYMETDLEPCVREGLRAAAGLCRDLGARIVDVKLPHTRFAIATYYLLSSAEASANLARFDGVRYGLRVEGSDLLDQYAKTRSAGFGDEVKRRIILGTYALSSGYYDAYYRRAQQVRSLLRNDFERAFEQVDALLTPVAPTTAYPLGEKTGRPLDMYLGDVFTVPANLAGLCGLSMPCAFSDEGLPVGLQLLGPPAGEEVLFRAGHALEQSLKLSGRRPPRITEPTEDQRQP